MNQYSCFIDNNIRIRLIDSTSFEIEETLDFKLPLIPKLNRGWLPPSPERSNVFFDPDGEMMYAENNGTLYEWKLRAREGPEWWLSEG